ncbi:MAG TPA: hypothetical protein VHO67_20910 [Polyangia bacterium]|nr:hypothetical protein [Polyangia bacterium]
MRLKSLAAVVGQAIAGVAGSMLIGLVLVGPSYAVAQAFRTRVDIPGCRATCEKHRLLFDDYYSDKSGDGCICRQPEDPRRWRVFEESYHVLGGDSPGAAVLDVLIRGVAVVGVFILNVALLLAALVLLLRWRRRRKPTSS